MLGEFNPMSFGEPAETEEGLRPGEFWANRNISFEVRRGECLGLLGHNGAGKTTLLRMLNGLIKPDTGRIEMRGRVTGLIALGAGFNPLLSGRENIYINGSILGLSQREIKTKLDEIIDFAEIREFIDSPVQSYSSGMQVRLGFSIATAMKPDVLILDEVLAVGDFSFRMKCFKRIAALLENAAVLFVSHQIQQVRRICSHGVYLNRGVPLYVGDIAGTIAAYESESDTFGNSSSYREPDMEYAEIILKESRFHFMKPIRIGLRCRSRVGYRNAIARILFTAPSGEVAGEWHSGNHQKTYDLEKCHDHEIEFHIDSLAICPGIYRLSVILSDAQNRSNIIHISRKDAIQVIGPDGLWNLRQL